LRVARFPASPRPAGVQNGLYNFLQLLAIGGLISNEITRTVDKAL
jgi:hypothetical protein